MQSRSAHSLCADQQLSSWCRLIPTRPQLEQWMSRGSYGLRHCLQHFLTLQRPLADRGKDARCHPSLKPLVPDASMRATGEQPPLLVPSELLHGERS